MDSTTIAYIAGFFDGEGCVLINRLHVHGYLVHQICARVTNCNLEVLEWIRDQAGGLGQIKPKPRYSERHTQGYTWLMSSRHAERFLLLVLPYLRLKRRQAKLALALQAEITANHGKTLPPGERDRRDTIWIQIKALNRPPIES